ncbi:DedA family protein [bacterium LRH843]|nr:DedA family protein [bacterium LRH843]
MKLLELIEKLFAHYGYMVLILGLPLDAIALPIPPGNTTLTYAGYLAYKGVLDWLPTVTAAFTGSFLGMTITYWIGNKIGMPLIKRYGKWLFIKPKHIVKTRRNYRKYGNKMIIFCYFMPGVRQFIGYFTGTIRVPYRIFALYASIGSAIWVLVFTGIGYLFGDQWQFIFTKVEHVLSYIFIIFLIVLLIYFVLKWRKRKRSKSIS